VVKTDGANSGRRWRARGGRRRRRAAGDRRRAGAAAAACLPTCAYITRGGSAQRTAPSKHAIGRQTLVPRLTSENGETATRDVVFVAAVAATGFDDGADGASGMASGRPACLTVRMGWRVAVLLCKSSWDGRSTVAVGTPWADGDDSAVTGGTVGRRALLFHRICLFVVPCAAGFAPRLALRASLPAAPAGRGSFYWRLQRSGVFCSHTAPRAAPLQNKSVHPSYHYGETTAALYRSAGGRSVYTGFASAITSFLSHCVLPPTLPLFFSLQGAGWALPLLTVPCLLLHHCGTAGAKRCCPAASASALQPPAC